MRILRRDSHAQGTHLVLMFGLGMLGSSIRASLQDAQFAPSEVLDFRWNEPLTWPHSLAAIEQHCRSCSPRRISVSWAAGKAGFSCTPDEAARENESFQAVVAMASRLMRLPSLEHFDFHYVSSAGGLFEGQRVVDRSSAPSPMRPYGQLKLSQEQVLQTTFAPRELAIYRPSTVYGPMAQKAHHGLINNLVNDGLRGRLTVLDAQVMSLRDYVYFADIGAFIAGQIKSRARRSTETAVNFLVSSRCASIFEVVRNIERVLHLKLRFRYDETFGNHSNITFSGRVLPAGWSPTPLEVGIRQFVAGKHACLQAPIRA
jgi:UDP-glucose 4-epimerase